MINTKTQEAVLDIVNFLSEKKITHLYPDNESFLDNTIQLRGEKPTVNFGSCSYLGLEFNDNLKQGAINAVQNYGTQFSISRSYMSCPLYEDLEKNFKAIFGKPCVVTPTTTLGHISAIPVLVSDDDAIILDHQVHSSVQMAVQMIKSNGITIQMIRHSRMDQLEDRILKLRKNHKKIWYMADGIYSMYGDFAPLDEIYALMEKYPELHLYIDDAHGMSCFGDKGQGYVLGHSEINDRTIVSLSLAKAFGSGGAVFVFPNEDWARKVQCTGLPMITSGPIQPAVLGASIASSAIHLTPEINKLQEDLKENIKYANFLIKKYKLPLLHSNESPIFFIGAGLPKTGRNIVNRLMNEGVYVNIGIFPAVPMKNTGIRFTITRLHTFEQIEHLVKSLAYHYPRALKEEGVTMDQVCKYFNLPTEDYLIEKEVESVIQYSELSIERYRSIHSVNKNEWDSIFAFNGQMKADQFELLEKVYQNNDQKENNWDFNYLYVKDPNGKVVVAAPLITFLQKDDILHSEEVSNSIEKIREKDPYYLTSRVLMSGAPVSIGKSIYIDLDSKYINEAISKFTKHVTEIQKETNAKSIMLRDFVDEDIILKTKFQEVGFFKVNSMKSNVIKKLPKSMEEFRASLSKNAKRHIKRKVDKYANNFEYKVVKNPSQKKLKDWYQLYNNVAHDKREINMFTMPFSLFSNLVNSCSWEIHELTTKPSLLGEEPKTVGVLFIHVDRSGKVITPNYIGLDRNYRDQGIYQQLLYNVIEYSVAEGFETMELGTTADFEKSRFGAQTIQHFALYQVDDHYNVNHIEAVHANKRSI